MKVLQINTTVNTGSTGRIAEDIGLVLMKNGHESFIAYGRANQPSKSNLIKIGTQKDIYLHGIKTALFDRHGFGSKTATQKLINRIDEIKPDIIGLHNLHGYYLNIEEIFRYLDKINIPVIWTLFDCWAFTGHCTYFDDIDCKKWQTQCSVCPKKLKYPSSYFLDNSKNNHLDKKNLFSLPKKLEIIVHSDWLRRLVKKSFFKNKNVHHIFSGIDLDKFSIQAIKGKMDKKIILGVASVWDKRKGLDDFINLRKLLSTDYHLVLIGLSSTQIKLLPNGVEGIERTESIKDLALWYNKALVFVNPTFQDNFPTTNLEALACGTSVITYNTGGSPEAIDEHTGRVVKKGDIDGLVKAIRELEKIPQCKLSTDCRTRAVKMFNKDNQYMDYLKLYENVLN